MRICIYATRGACACTSRRFVGSASGYNDSKAVQAPHDTVCTQARWRSQWSACQSRVGDLPAPEVVALLSPFLHPTMHTVANNMLFVYIKYHMVLGIKRYVQYTQARHVLA